MLIKLKFSILGPKRFTKPALEVKDLPNIDAVVISHSHYDHLDVETVRKLFSRFGENLKWFVPLGLKSWFQSLRISNVEGLSFISRMYMYM